MIPQISLIASLLVLFLGPFLYGRFRNSSSQSQKRLEKVSSILVLFFIVLELIDHAGHISWGKFSLVFLGFYGFSLLFEKYLFKLSNQKKASSWFSLSYFIPAIGLILHAITDGVVLQESLFYLPMAVIIHRIPASLFIWGLFYRVFGKLVPSLLLMLLGLGTVVGFFVSKELLPDHHYFQYFQAAVAGTILHISFKSKRKEDSPPKEASSST